MLCRQSLRNGAEFFVGITIDTFVFIILSKGYHKERIIVILSSYEKKKRTHVTFFCNIFLV